MKTIKQISDELGVDKQKVYRFVVKNRITASSEVKQSKLYDEAAESLIKSHFNHITTSNERCDLPHQKSGQEQLFEQLIKELEIKNEQIKEKDRQLAEKDRQINAVHERLAEMTETLAAAQQMAQAAQALHAGTIQQQLTSGGDSGTAGSAPSSQPLSLWQRIFRKEKV